MKKEFISYEQALELKELGFDESCLMAYIGKDNQLYSKCDDVLHLNTIDDVLNPLKAPLFSQAFRWFRENYGFVGIILGDGFNGVLKGYYYSITEDGWIYYYESIDDGEWYEVYEEAELACLNKLIEIVKGGNNE